MVTKTPYCSRARAGREGELYESCNPTLFEFGKGKE